MLLYLLFRVGGCLSLLWAFSCRPYSSHSNWPCFNPSCISALCQMMIHLCSKASFPQLYCRFLEIRASVLDKSGFPEAYSQCQIEKWTVAQSVLTRLPDGTKFLWACWAGTRAPPTAEWWFQGMLLWCSHLTGVLASFVLQWCYLEAGNPVLVLLY